jgi:hypothetical protein
MLANISFLSSAVLSNCGVLSKYIEGSALSREFKPRVGSISSKRLKL